MTESKIIIKNISAEKFWDEEKAIPDQVRVSTNVNITGLDHREDSLSVPFVVNIGYDPSLAQITFRGSALVKGRKAELDEIEKKYENKENPPDKLVQNIINKAMVEATLVSRTLEIPPPIPLPKVQSQKNSEDNNGLNYVG